MCLQAKFVPSHAVKQQLLSMQQWKRKQAQKCCPVPSGLEAEAEAVKMNRFRNSTEQLQNDHCLQNDH